MKIFKKLATLSMVLTFVLGLGALTACNGDDSSSAPASSSASASVSSEENKVYNYYEFIVLDADGNKVSDGYKVQLCTSDGNNCFNPVNTVNGECVYNALPDNDNAPGEYVVHVLDASYQEVALKEAVTTSADAFGLYTIQLAPVEAE